jgi:hypothetical protein
MDYHSRIRKELESQWIPDIYLNEIRPLRTRAVKMEISEKENAPAVHETLLGMELKVGKQRIACPDLNTARYLRVFARLGCREIAIPYDITMLGALADRLEHAWIALSEGIDGLLSGKLPQAAGRMRASIIRSVREEIKSSGAGECMPAFDKNTKQRAR